MDKRSAEANRQDPVPDDDRLAGVHFSHPIFVGQNRYHASIGQVVCMLSCRERESVGPDRVRPIDLEQDFMVR